MALNLLTYLMVLTPVVEFRVECLEVEVVVCGESERGDDVAGVVRRQELLEPHLPHTRPQHCAVLAVPGVQTEGNNQ